MLRGGWSLRGLRRGRHREAGTGGQDGLVPGAGGSDECDARGPRTSRLCHKMAQKVGWALDSGVSRGIFSRNDVPLRERTSPGVLARYKVGKKEHPRQAKSAALASARWVCSSDRACIVADEGRLFGGWADGGVAVLRLSGAVCLRATIARAVRVNGRVRLGRSGKEGACREVTCGGPFSFLLVRGGRRSVREVRGRRREAVPGRRCAPK